MSQIAKTVISHIVTCPKLLNLYRDKLQHDYFPDATFKAIYSDILTAVSERKDISAYLLKNKYGPIIDELVIPGFNEAKAIPIMDQAISDLIYQHTARLFSDGCSDYLAKYHSGEIINHDEVLNNLSSHIIRNDEIKVYDNSDAIECLSRKLDSNAPVGEMALGINPIDQTLNGGANRGQVMYVAGRPKIFKTSMILNIFTRMTINHSGIFFSLEMSRDEVWQKQCGIIEAKSFEFARQYNQPFNAYGEHMQLTKGNAHVVDSKEVSIHDIKRLIRLHKLRHGKLDFVIIDHLGIIKKSRANYSEYEHVTEITRELKIIAGMENIFIICISQLNRASADRKDKRPVLTELRGSGSIEQDADYVLTLYREEHYYRENGRSCPPAIQNVLEVNLAANRHGPQADYKFKVNLALGKILHQLSPTELAQYSAALREGKSFNSGGF